MLEFNQSNKSRDLFKLCDWPNFRVELNFKLEFLYMIGSVLVGRCLEATGTGSNIVAAETDRNE